MEASPELRALNALPIASTHPFMVKIFFKSSPEKYNILFASIKSSVAVFKISHPFPGRAFYADYPVVSVTHRGVVLSMATRQAGRTPHVLFLACFPFTRVRIQQTSRYKGLGHPFFSAVLDNIPQNIATRNAKGEPVVTAVRKKAKHKTAKRFL
jgi:hypothetical protein